MEERRHWKKGVHGFLEKNAHRVPRGSTPRQRRPAAELCACLAVGPLAEELARRSDKINASRLIRFGGGRVGGPRAEVWHQQQPPNKKGGLLVVGFQADLGIWSLGRVGNRWTFGNLARLGVASRQKDP